MTLDLFDAVDSREKTLEANMGEYTGEPMRGRARPASLTVIFASAET